jgi:hypothetical protein
MGASIADGSGSLLQVVLFVGSGSQQWWFLVDMPPCQRLSVDCLGQGAISTSLVHSCRLCALSDCSVWALPVFLTFVQTGNAATFAAPAASDASHSRGRMFWWR